MACIPPNPRKMGYIVPIHGPLDGPLYMGSIYTNKQDISKNARSTRDEGYSTTASPAIKKSVR